MIVEDFRMHHRERGFTLVEMLVTLGILSILTFVTVGVFGSWMLRQRLDLSGRETIALLQRGRILAIKRSSTTRVVLSVVIKPATSEIVGGIAELEERNPSGNWTRVDGVRAEVVLAEGALFTTDTNTDLHSPVSPEPSVYVFRNNGRIADGSDGIIGSDITTSTLVLQNHYGHQVWIELKPTGKITLLKKAGEEG
jgi:prepilin-type N-terminal cleavage/methylation domain-containing protein